MSNPAHWTCFDGCRQQQLSVFSFVHLCDCTDRGASVGVCSTILHNSYAFLSATGSVRNLTGRCWETPMKEIVWKIRTIFCPFYFFTKHKRQVLKLKVQITESLNIFIVCLVVILESQQALTGLDWVVLCDRAWDTHAVWFQRRGELYTRNPD